MNKDTQKVNKVNAAEESFLLYYKDAYLLAQQYAHLKVYSNDCFEVCFSLKTETATSLSSSPFGGIRSIKKAKLTQLKSFFDQLKTQLKLAGVQKIRLVQPPAYYLGFINNEWLKTLGFEEVSVELNQFVALTKPILFDKMQQRQLKKAKDFNIRKVAVAELPKIHTFIAHCRKEKGLEINISQEKLISLFEALPESYDCFVVEKENQLIAAVVTANVTPDICYYYLPATLQAFKHKSPMVHLLNYLYGYYRDAGFEYLDLGLSSVRGVKQASLFQFKERMGATSTLRSTFETEI